MILSWWLRQILTHTTPHTWQPTYSGGGGVAEQTLTRANYFRLGNKVFIDLSVTVQMSAAAADAVIISLPYAYKNVVSPFAVSVFDASVSGAGDVAGAAYTQDTNKIHVVIFDRRDWATGANLGINVWGGYEKS